MLALVTNSSCEQSTSIQLDPHPPPKQVAKTQRVRFWYDVFHLLVTTSTVFSFIELAEVGDRKGSSGHEHDPGLIKIVDPDKVCKRPFYGKDSFVLSFVKSLCSFCYCCHRNTAQVTQLHCLTVEKMTQRAMKKLHNPQFTQSDDHQKFDFTSKYDLWSLRYSEKLTYNKFEVSDFLNFEKILKIRLKWQKRVHFTNFFLTKAFT